jgi:hypothetical protein
VELELLVFRDGRGHVARLAAGSRKPGCGRSD